MFFDWLTVGRLWVRDDMRGIGIGSQMLVAAEDQAKQSGFSTVVLKPDQM